jgi:23S rRNA pseudouridine955/2504/2580 synthase
VRKKYLCLMDGVLNEDRVTVNEAIRKVSRGGESIMEVHADGKPAITHFKRLQTLPGSTYVEVELVTGRTHQIRVHAAHLGLPLAGDERYGSPASVRKWKKIGLNRLFLHAHHLSFSGPGSGILTFDAPLPDALREVLDSLSA